MNLLVLIKYNPRIKSNFLLIKKFSKFILSKNRLFIKNIANKNLQNLPYA